MLQGEDSLSVHHTHLKQQAIVPNYQKQKMVKDKMYSYNSSTGGEVAVWPARSTGSRRGMFWRNDNCSGFAVNCLGMVGLFVKQPASENADQRLDLTLLAKGQ